MRCMFRVEEETRLSRYAHNICESRWRKNEEDFASIAKSFFDNIQRSNGCIERETFDNISSSNHLVTVQTNHFQKIEFLRFKIFRFKICVEFRSSATVLKLE